MSLAPLTRVRDWEARLADWTHDAERAVWVWGAWDCVHAAAAWVRLATGRDVLAALGLRYHDAAGALAEIGRRGGLQAAVTHVMGKPLPDCHFAARGDLVLVRAGRHDALAVCVGPSALLPLALGAQRIGASDWRVAWRV